MVGARRQGGKEADGTGKQERQTQDIFSRELKVTEIHEEKENERRERTTE